MNYHNPDSTWHVFDQITDFETFKNQFVVEGKFHSLVPEDIQKSYRIVEYIMAHSYYHYPMYDEALNKALRTLEMAVKLRCDQLNISLEKTNQNKPKFPSPKYTLSELISKLNAEEPMKYDMREMDRLRNLRNIFMHPENNSFGGVALVGLLYKMVVVLNKIFLPANFFVRSSALNKLVNTDFFTLAAQPFVLNFQNTRYLITEVNALASIPQDLESLHCLFIAPLPNRASELIAQHKYLPHWSFHVSNIINNNVNITAKIIGTNDRLSIQRTEHESDLKLYEEFCEALKNSSPKDIAIYNSFYNFRKGEELNKFYYNHLCNVDPSLK